MGIYKIPVYQPYLKGNERKYVNDCIDSTWISSKGEYIPKFENRFADYIGVDYTTSVCNGTVALHLAMVALGIGPGDEIIVPTLTYISSVNSIVYTGATPVFVDSERDYWQIDPEEVRKKITSKTKAVMAVHLYGHACQMDELVELCNKNRVFLIEDCAEAIGTKYKNKHVGNFGDIATFSFFGNKTITTGEGGMVVTNDATLYERIVHLKLQGLAKYRQYWHDIVGYNYRMTNICAAIGLAQLEQIDKILLLKRKIAQIYIDNLPKEITYHKESSYGYHSYWMFSILTNKPSQRDALRDYIESHKIETRPVFYPIHTMPIFSAKYEKHKEAERIASCGINLPSYPDLSEEQILYITETIKNYFKKTR